MKSCNSKTVETLKHFDCPTAVQGADCVCTKSQCISSHIYNIDMYTSPFEWTISKYSIPFEIIPRLIPSHFKGHLRDMYLQVHTWIHLHFKNCHKCQSDYSPGQSTPFHYMHLFFFSPEAFSQLRPVTELCINNYQLKWPLEGCSAPHQVALSGWSPLRRPGLGSQVTWITGWDGSGRRLCPQGHSW